MEIKNVKTEEITPYENNPRRNEKAVEAVKISIEEYGFRVPVILTKEKVLVCGHTRLKAAKLMGLTEIPAIFVEDLTKEQIKAFRIADNKVSEASTWDFEKLEAELEEIEVTKEELEDLSVPEGINIDDHVKMYLKDIGKIPLLDPDREAYIAEKIAEELNNRYAAHGSQLIAHSQNYERNHQNNIQ